MFSFTPIFSFSYFLVYIQLQRHDRCGDIIKILEPGLGIHHQLSHFVIKSLDLSEPQCPWEDKTRECAFNKSAAPKKGSNNNYHHHHLEMQVAVFRPGPKQKL